MATSTPQDDFMKTALRLPRELHGRLMDAARLNNRSFNAELLARLDSSFSADGAKLPPLTLTVNQLAEPATQVVTARVVPPDELAAAVAQAVHPAMDRMERQYLWMQMRLLQDRKRLIEDSLSLLHLPLAEALEELEAAGTSGVQAQLNEKRAAVSTIRERMESHDEQIAQVVQEINEIRRELGDVVAEGETPAQRAEALRRLSAVHSSK